MRTRYKVGTKAKCNHCGKRAQWRVSDNACVILCGACAKDIPIAQPKDKEEHYTEADYQTWMRL